MIMHACLRSNACGRVLVVEWLWRMVCGREAQRYAGARCAALRVGRAGQGRLGAHLEQAVADIVKDVRQCARNYRNKAKRKREEGKQVAAEDLPIGKQLKGSLGKCRKSCLPRQGSRRVPSAFLIATRPLFFFRSCLDATRHSAPDDVRFRRDEGPPPRERGLSGDRR